MAFPTFPRTSSAFQSTRSRVLDTTYFFAASIARAKAASMLPPSFRKSPAKKEGISLDEVLDRMTMQVFVREHETMIAASVQSDVDGIPKGSHYVLLKRDDDLALALRATGKGIISNRKTESPAAGR